MKNKKLKILEICEFSAGICGVWQRVKQESAELSKKDYEVRVFSSNAVKGSNEIAKSMEIINSIKIIRFPFKKLGGESFMSWDFEKNALKYSPDIIIAHGYRHLHTTKALKIAEKLKKQGKECKVFLVTHAPFIENNSTRSFFGKIAVNFYDRIIGQRTINRFDKVIAITQWEIPSLLKLGCKKEKIVYIPNGIPEEFFKGKIKKGKNILFLGRISPIKDIEVLIRTMKNTNSRLDLVGPAEEDYRKHLLGLVRKEKINNIHFLPAVYDLKKKINLIDNYEIFVLPSKTEAMPQALLEAMARGKLVISSGTKGGKEIVTERNGFLFKIGDGKQLTKLINKIGRMSENQKDKFRGKARKTAEKFCCSKLIKSLEKLFS